jgi:hypothetical protein
VGTPAPASSTARPFTSTRASKAASRTPSTAIVKWSRLPTFAFAGPVSVTAGCAATAVCVLAAAHAVAASAPRSVRRIFIGLLPRMRGQGSAVLPLPRGHPEGTVICTDCKSTRALSTARTSAAATPAGSGAPTAGYRLVTGPGWRSVPVADAVDRVVDDQSLPAASRTIEPCPGRAQRPFECRIALDRRPTASPNRWNGPNGERARGTTAA